MCTFTAGPGEEVHSTEAQPKPQDDLIASAGLMLPKKPWNYTCDVPGAINTGIHQHSVLKCRHMVSSWHSGQIISVWDFDHPKVIFYSLITWQTQLQLVYEPEGWGPESSHGDLCRGEKPHKPRSWTYTVFTQLSNVFLWVNRNPQTSR